MIKNRDICLEKQPFEETNFVKFRFSLHSDDLNCMELYGYMDIYMVIWIILLLLLSTGEY